MSDDILDMYGKDSYTGQKPRATTGGTKDAKPLAYSEPVGPKNKTEVGRNGTNYGCCGSQGKH